MIKILVADDHPLLIDGIRTSLAGIEDFLITEDAQNGYKVLEKLDGGAEVDIILMDINMPLMDGLQCTRAVTRKYPHIRVIALSQYDEKRFVKQMVKNGASGYLLKDSGKDLLEKAIRTVFAGGKYFCDRLSARLVSQELKLENNSTLFPKLSSRELEVLQLIGKEHSTQEIADMLYISPHTVESHRSNLMLKAGVKNTAGLIRWAVENDLLD